MFCLTNRDLHGSVLDCPGGGSSFTVEASDLGTRVTAVDPVYAMSTSMLQELVMAQPDRGSAHTAAGFERYMWDFYGDIEGHREMRKRSASLFARDIEVHTERYIPASLPILPFEETTRKMSTTPNRATPGSNGKGKTARLWLIVRFFVSLRWLHSGSCWRRSRRRWRRRRDGQTRRSFDQRPFLPLNLNGGRLYVSQISAAELASPRARNKCGATFRTGTRRRFQVVELRIAWPFSTGFKLSSSS